MNQKGSISSAFGIIVTLVIAVGVGGYIYSQSLIPDKSETIPAPLHAGDKQTHSPTPLPEVACTQEAKQCPDGSYVGRTGPKCEFVACPSEKTSSQSAVPADWKTYRNEKFGFEFSYPDTLKVKEGPDLPNTQKSVFFTRYNSDYETDIPVGVGIQLFSKNTGLSYEKTFENLKTLFPDIQKVTINNISALRYSTPQIQILVILDASHFIVLAANSGEYNAHQHDYDMVAASTHLINR